MKNVNPHTVRRFYNVVKTRLREWCQSFKYGKRLDSNLTISFKDALLTAKSNVEDVTVSEMLGKI